MQAESIAFHEVMWRLLAAQLIARQGLIRNQAKVMGVIMNKVPQDSKGQLQKALRTGLQDVGLPVFGAIPRDPFLASVRCAVLTHHQLLHQTCPDWHA